ncbi:uncharacterized protein LOC132704807 isoform X2 [Cylas formicarius]|uniref:uncharacterized protein LOC132704807 isoform X2 n=1 Tax=Cylas formicarius TaxID=197179 RepID=UPI00295886E5|nr:uncharacterized protein LOC132704807 isoform X2 [Cylas formicarius]
MQILTVYLFLLGLLSAAAHEGLPLLAPGGIGGIFKGPDSETIIQGPDGSVITSEQEGGAVVRGNGLEQPIVVAESVQEIESDHAIEQVLIQEQPKVQSEIAQGILLKTVPAPQNQFPGPQPVLTEIKQSPFIESTATIQQNQPILLKEAAEAAESAKLLVEPIRQPLSVSRVPVLTHKFSVSNLEPVVSSTAAPLGQSTALPSSTPRTLLEISNANLIESDKINLGDVRSLNRGLPQLQHRSSNGFVGNPELILNENLVSFSDAQLVSSNAADLTKAKEQIQRVPLEKFILADETLDIENIAGGQILNQAKLVNSQPIPLGQYILQDQKSVIPQADNEGTLNQAKAGQGPQIPLNQYILIQDRLANPKVTREQILRPGNELGQDDRIDRVRRSTQRSRKRKQSYHTLNNEESNSGQVPSNDNGGYSADPLSNDIQQPTNHIYYPQLGDQYPAANPNQNIRQEYHQQNAHPYVDDQQNSDLYYEQVRTSNAQVGEQRQLQGETYPQSDNLQYGSRIQSSKKPNIVLNPKANSNYQYRKNARVDDASQFPEQFYRQHGIVQSYNQHSDVAKQDAQNENYISNYDPRYSGNAQLEHQGIPQTQLYLTSADPQGKVITKEQAVINVQVESDSAAVEHPDQRTGRENLVNYRIKTLSLQPASQLPEISEHIPQDRDRLHLSIPEEALHDYYQQKEKYSDQQPETDYYPDTNQNYGQPIDIRGTLFQKLRSHVTNPAYLEALPRTTANNTPVVLGLDNTTFDVTGNVDYQDSPYSGRNPTLNHFQPQTDDYSASGYRQPVLLGPGDHLLPVNLSIAVNPSAVPIRNLWYIPGINISITTTFAPSVSPPTTIATDLVSPTSSPFNISSDYYIANNARSGNLAGNSIVSKKLFAFSTGQVLLRNLTDIGGAIIGNLTYPPPTRSPILKTTRSPFRTTTQRSGLLFSVIRSIAQMIG